MAPNEHPTDKASVKEFVEAHGIHTFKMGVDDLYGIWRGKRIAADYFVKSVVESGSYIADILFGWDSADEPIPNLEFTGPHTGFPDMNIRPDLSTLSAVPWEPGVASVICDAFDRQGNPIHLSPRGVLRSMVERAHSMGYDPIAAYEFEFYLLRGKPTELSRDGWRTLDPITDGRHTYGMYRDAGVEFIIGDIRQQLADYGVFIEASNGEYGPGQYEVNIHYSGALQAADNAMLLKHTVKELAARRGYTATFMAKVKSDWPGSSGHVHLSLQDFDGNPVFANPANPNELSAVGTQYLAGLVEHAPDFALTYLPNINSYRRMAKPDFSPATIAWSVDNRTVAIRSIPGAGGGARVENRLAGADANPYLVVAASLASGLGGIENQLQPPAPITGDAAAADGSAAPAVPTSLSEAVNRFDESAFARKLFGDKFVDHVCAMRRWDIATAAAAVTDWETNRYIEVI